MFGDDLILESGSGKLDNKGRFFVPSSTNVEENDKIILEMINSNDGVTLKLHVYQKYFDIISRFTKLRDNATSQEDFLKYEKEIESICAKLHAIVTADKQKRIIIPKQIVDNLGWNTFEPVQYEGLGTSLLLSQKK